MTEAECLAALDSLASDVNALADAYADLRAKYEELADAPCAECEDREAEPVDKLAAKLHEAWDVPLEKLL